MKRLYNFSVSALLSLAFLSLASNLSAQEALKSVEEEYYDFLSLSGIVERPTLGYRTLSDSVWTFNEVTSFMKNEDGTFTKVRTQGKESDGHIWKNNNLGTTFTLYQGDSDGTNAVDGTGSTGNWFTRGIKRSVTARFYGPEWYNSYNTASPYGQNDGALWQGKGYNTSLTAGARLEGYGFELTIKPQVSWSENKGFDFITPNAAYSGENYAGKANTYGYYGVEYIDAPQRFGDSSFFTFDWGDTEVRWSWNTFTLGFGTQAIWLGPAQLNPIIHSNNAASYPKFDIGLRKTKVTMPYFGWDLGYIEGRAWWGKLTESEWFDNDETNDNNLIAGLSASYAFTGFLKGFSIGFNRIMLSKWDDIRPYTLFTIMVPGMDIGAGHDENDQRASLTFEYLVTEFGLDLYFEWARNDYTSGGIIPVLQNPFHTSSWTAGIRKLFNIRNFNLELLYEFTTLDCSRDYTTIIGWYSTFYSHHIIKQGHTNRGQCLGAGIGTGSTSHYLGANIYTKTDKITIFVQRWNPDLDYSYFIDSKNNPDTAEISIKACLDAGVSVTHYLTPSLSITGGYTADIIINPLNRSNGKERDYLLNNFFTLGLKYSL